MKVRSIFFSTVFALSVVGLLGGCSGNQKGDVNETHAEHEGQGNGASEGTSGADEIGAAKEPQFQVDEKFQDQLSSVFTSYVDLKDALVASDAEKAREEASQTQDALAKVDMRLLSGAAHNDWMNFQTPIQNSLSEIRSSSDLDTQRKSFSTLTDNLYKSVKAFGLGGEEAYYEYCPMAFNNQGAYWLSENEKIRNPYFGDKMLTCGEVKEKLK